MRRTAAGVALTTLTLLAGLAMATTAQAAILSCGQTITQNTTLDNDVGPCASNGIIVGADNITFDLNGHRIFGTGNSGDGAGVLVRERTGVTVRRGTVNDFDAGVAILGGSSNSVTAMVARHNYGAVFGTPGPAAQFGDGILVQGSSNNSIVGNEAVDNGPFGGISLIAGDSDHPAVPPALVLNNLVQGNKVNNNVACRRGTTPFCDNDGIRVEPRVGGLCLTGSVICPGPGNRIIANQVNANALDGISLFGFTTNNLVLANEVNVNGFLGAAPGDGVRVFGSNNTIQNNSAFGNRAGGISVARRPPAAGSFPPGNPNGRNNVLTRNVAGRNVIFDLWDSNRNPDCDNNRWSGNIGRLVAPPCPLNP